MTDEQRDEQFYRDTENIAFPKLDDHQLSLLEPLGKKRVLKRGELLFKAGQRDVGMLQGTSVLATARVTSEETEILHVPATELRRAFTELPGVSEPIVKALIMRRKRLRRDREFAGLRVLAAAGTREGHQLDDFLDKNRIPHRLIELETEQGQALSKRLHLTTRDLPALITPAGAPLRRPSLREVAQVAGLLRPLAFEDQSEIMSDVTIVGADPAGRAGRVF